MYLAYHSTEQLIEVGLLNLPTSYSVVDAFNTI
jgi:hypothetical protein